MEIANDGGQSYRQRKQQSLPFIIIISMTIVKIATIIF